MKTVFILLILSCAFARADIIQITAQGTLEDYPVPPSSQPINWDSSVPVYPNGNPIPFAFSATFNDAAVAGTPITGAGYTLYGWALGASSSESFSFGDYSFTYSGLSLTADTYSTGTALFLNSPDETIFGLPFNSILRFDLNESVDGGALANVQDLLATGDVIDSLFAMQPSGNNNDAINGIVTTYSVEDISAPESSTWAMLLGGLGSLVFCRFTLKSRT